MLDDHPKHSLGGGFPWQFGMLPETLILSQTKIPKGGGGVGTPGNSWWKCAAQFSKSWPYFRTKNVIFHTRFQTRSLKSVPISDLAFRQKLCYHYVDYSANKKNSSNPFQIRIFLFLFYSFGIETITSSIIHSLSSLKNHTWFQTKMAKVYTRFQTKTAQKRYPMGRHIPI